jgi:hypothetical protein
MWIRSGATARTWRAALPATIACNRRVCPMAQRRTLDYISRISSTRALATARCPRVVGSLCPYRTRTCVVDRLIMLGVLTICQVTAGVCCCLTRPGTNPLGCTPVFRFSALFNDGYNAGVRIHSNSWGSTLGDAQTPLQATAYDSTCQELDTYVYLNDDFLVRNSLNRT